MKITAAFIALAALLTASAVRAQGDSSQRIMATPVTSDSLNRVAPYPQTEGLSNGSDQNGKLGIEVNKDQDRVGATYQICNDPEQITCGTATYVFPQLKVDKDNRQILLGDTVVGRYGAGGGVHLENGYQLRSEVAQGETDTGFERYPSKHVKVFIEKAR